MVNKIHDEDGLVYAEEIITNKKGNIINEKHQNFVSSTDEPAGTVTIGQQSTYLCVWKFNNYSTGQTI